MTKCIDGVCYMTDQVQFTTMVTALFAVFLVVLGIWGIVRQIIEEDIKDATNKDIAQFTEEMYLNRGERPCHGRNSNVCVAEGCYGQACLRTKAVKLESQISGQLISPQGLAWLERKLGL